MGLPARWKPNIIDAEFRVVRNARRRRRGRTPILFRAHEVVAAAWCACGLVLLGVIAAKALGLI